MQRQQLARPRAPVDDLDIAAARPGRSPPAAACAPAAVGEPPLLEQIEAVRRTRVGREPHPREHHERLDEVVVPERRRVQRGERLVDRLARRKRTEEAVLYPAALLIGRYLDCRLGPQARR